MFPQRNRSAHAVGDETRSALIGAATEVFIADGFRAARIQDIAKQAGVRLSAINYHFGSKEGLYLAVLQHHAEAAVGSTPLQPPDPRLPLRKRFDHLVRNMLVRLLDEENGSRLAPLLMREMSNPTPALDYMFENFSKPQGAIFMQVVGEILGPGVPKRDLLRASLSVMGQCMVYRFARPMVERFDAKFYRQDDLIDTLAAHIAQFSWAGLKALAAARKTS